MKNFWLCVKVFFCVTYIYGVEFPPNVQKLFIKQNQDKELTKYIEKFNFADYIIVESIDRDRFYIDKLYYYKKQFDGIKNVLCKTKSWELYLRKILETFVKEGSTAIDVGAHIGFHTFALSRYVGEEGMVIAFEPQKKIYREFVYNSLLNNKNNNILGLQYALGDCKKKVFMDVPNVCNEGGTKVIRQTMQQGKKGQERVNMIPLDSLDIKNISFMKIDAEESEDIILDGAKETILREKPVILIEIMGNYRNDLPNEEKLWIIQKKKKTIAKLQSLGYRVIRVWVNDYLALPKKQFLNFSKNVFNAFVSKSLVD